MPMIYKDITQQRKFMGLHILLSCKIAINLIELMFL